MKSRLRASSSTEWTTHSSLRSTTTLTTSKMSLSRRSRWTKNMKCSTPTSTRKTDISRCTTESSPTSDSLSGELAWLTILLPATKTSCLKFGAPNPFRSTTDGPKLRANLVMEEPKMRNSFSTNLTQVMANTGASCRTSKSSILQLTSSYKT